MKRGNKIRRIVILGAAGLALATGLTGCSRPIEEAQANIEDKVVTVLKADEETPIGCQPLDGLFCSIQSVKSISDINLKYTPSLLRKLRT